MADSEPLEIEQDLAHLRLSWRLQRWTWALLTLLLLAALAGAFGGGPLSHVERDGLAYERIARYAAPSRLTIQSGALRVRIERQFVQDVDIQRITPEPESVAAAGEWMEYRFRRADRIDIDYQPRRCGLREASLEVDDRPPRRLAQWVFP